MINNVEEWRDVGGYEGLYKISNRGRIKSYQGRYKKPKILKTTMTTTGYKKIELTKNKRKKSLKVHIYTEITKASLGKIKIEWFQNTKQELHYQHWRTNTAVAACRR